MVCAKGCAVGGDLRICFNQCLVSGLPYPTSEIDSTASQPAFVLTSEQNKLL